MGMLKTPAGLPVNAITVVLLILGIFSLALRQWPLMLILVAPFLFTLIAASLGKYPFSRTIVIVSCTFNISHPGGRCGKYWVGIAEVEQADRIPCLCHINGLSIGWPDNHCLWKLFFSTEER